MKKIIVPLTVVLSLLSIECGDKPEQLNSHQKSKPREVVTAESPLENRLRAIASKITGLNREDFILSTNMTIEEYIMLPQNLPVTSEDFRFFERISKPYEHPYFDSPFWFPSRDYMLSRSFVTTSKDDQHRVIFSDEKLEYLANAYRDKKEKGVWIIEEKGPSGKLLSRGKYKEESIEEKEKYFRSIDPSLSEDIIKKVRNRIVVSELDIFNENGEIIRFNQSREIYRIIDDKLQKDSNHYVGSYGYNEGDYFIEDRGHGKFFVIEEKRLDSKGKVIEEKGIFFDVKPEFLDRDKYTDSSMSHVRVKRSYGSEKLELDYQDKEIAEKIYRSIVPKNMLVN